MNQLATIQNQAQWTPEQYKLITDVVAKGATPDELKLFLYRCQHMGLDPLKPGMVHFIKYGTGAGTIVVGIDGFRSIAARTGKVSGVERGVHRDSDGKVVAGWCKVYRSDWTHPAHEEVPFGEYYKPNGNNRPGPWQTMPATMIKKVAEAAALRMAFPDDLGGVYERSEMDQAEADRRVGPEQPPLDDGHHVDRGYTIPFGKFMKRSLEEVDPKQLGSYVLYLEDQAQKKNQPITGQVKDFVDRAAAYLVALERGMVT